MMAIVFCENASAKCYDSSRDSGSGLAVGGDPAIRYVYLIFVCGFWTGGLTDYGSWTAGHVYPKSATATSYTPVLLIASACTAVPEFVVLETALVLVILCVPLTSIDLAISLVLV